jgi:hypothetical protein
MKKLIVAAALACGLGLFAVATNAADEKKDDSSASGKTFTGVLIDNQCGDKQKDAKAAAKHPKACAMKEACAKSGYQVVVGDKHLKFDEKGNTLAKEYLASEDNKTAVVVMGTPSSDGKTIKVTSIKAAPAEETTASDKVEKKAEKEKAEK